MTSRYYVTTPIYYVNGSPHIGHAYTSLAADVLARFNRLDGKEVFFLTGTDEHGQKVEQAAREKGLDVQAFTDEIAAQFKAMANDMDISYDDFIRTTEPRHKQAAQALWQRVADNGFIYLDAYEGWYALRDECFYNEDETTITPQGTRIAPTGAPVTWVREPSYFFRLSAFEEKLHELYASHADFIGPDGRYREIMGFLKQGLRDISISRTSFRWGIPVPGDDEHVMYVWFDALTNYLSALGFPDMSSSRMRFWPANAHLVGKDIIRFHAVFWPAFLMAAGIDVPHAIFANGWWTVEGEKMSKSLGNVVCPRALIDAFGLDPIRYFLLREVPFGGDSDLSQRALITRLNRDLANDFGNLAQRTLTQIARNCEGCLPERHILLEDDIQLMTQASELPTVLREHMARFALTEGLESIWRVVRACNSYIDRQAPWALKKTDPQRMRDVLRVLYDALRILATVLQPYMPQSMDRLLTQLGVEQNERKFGNLAALTPAGRRLPPPFALFPRFNVEEAAS